MTQEEYVIPPSTMSKILEEMKKLNYGLGNISDAVSQLPQDNECCKDEPEETPKSKYKNIEIHFKNGDMVSLDDPILTTDDGTYIVFTVEDKRWWFNLSALAYTVMTYN